MRSMVVTKHEDPASAALNALDAAVDALQSIDFGMMSTREHVAVLRRVETVARRLPAVGHQLLAALERSATPAELGNTMNRAVADILRITPAEARRRVADAEKLGPRLTMDGQPLEPVLTNTAAAQRSGRIGPGHVRVIRDFFTRLPGWVDAETRERAERDLAQLSGGLRPDELAQAAARMDMLINPDGNFTEQDRSRRRGITIGRQGADGMTPLRGWLDPECRATFEAVLSKLAAPGMCNPADESPCVDGPSEEHASRDGRTAAQRNHDAFKAAGRAVLASGKLGSHHGLPVTIIVSTTLAELEAGAGMALTAGGTLLPMADVRRLARHAFHYLVLFDGRGIPLNLGRTRRTASLGQRIVLHAQDRGCTHPGCSVPGFLCEVHHVDIDWRDEGRTDIDNLTFACGPHHRLIKPGGWQTRKNRLGITEWIPPPTVEAGHPRTNDFHHPERLIGRPPDTPAYDTPADPRTESTGGGDF